MDLAFSSRLLDILDEQRILEFTGRINVLQNNNEQLIGIILMKEGKIFFSKFRKKQGIKALGNLIVEDIINHSFKFIVEPEIVEGIRANIFEEVSNFVDKFKDSIKSTLSSQKLKPQPNLKICIDKDFILQGEYISADEFDVLCVISDFNKISDIYQECSLFDYEVTNALVTLRKKKALKVISQK